MENWFIPTESSQLPIAVRVLVISPHPDDEIFGCGGALALYRKQGVQIHVHVLTDGAGYATASERAAIYDLRQAETQAALKQIGVEPASFSGFPDRSLSGYPGLVQHVLELVQQHQADVVFAPSLWEIHPDHLAAGRAAWGAAMLMLQHGADAPTLLFYEVGTPQRTNLLIDITDVWSEKLQAMHCYPSQQQQQNYVRHIEALNIYRTYTLPAFVSHAEAFSMATPEQLAVLARTCGDPTQREMSRWIESALTAATAHVEALQASQKEGLRLLLKAELEMEQLRQKLSQVCYEKEQLLASTSWWLTAPVRWLGRRLRSAKGAN